MSLSQETPTQQHIKIIVNDQAGKPFYGMIHVDEILEDHMITRTSIYRYNLGSYHTVVLIGVPYLVSVENIVLGEIMVEPHQQSDEILTFTYTIEQDGAKRRKEWSHFARF
ncbi:hypothetical protein [Thermoflavimicrobium daqui]|jgi:hypothetical protein|uniref:Uncharacterized protein n=1 Tax=Thermoflavimicrobium daqui TaxID=2137476 RepID=A0A364K8E3_9BACL|nr:hypothetical protein [Thermoflavimicrobium daqui]RAL26492.1 hypothetical protein DL897_00020 [Thermoflavimicrobium daqui]